MPQPDELGFGQALPAFRNRKEPTATQTSFKTQPTGGKGGFSAYGAEGPDVVHHPFFAIDQTGSAMHAGERSTSLKRRL
jgi:hypothetical protein